MDLTVWEKQQARRYYDSITKNTFIFGKGVSEIGYYKVDSFENFLICIEERKKPLSEEELAFLGRLERKQILPFDELREIISLMVKIFKGIVKTTPYTDNIETFVE